ncbi:hypothetical protein [Streptomyces sp. SID13726]|uniref:hypothetical protein n=1 Tax=Streptomyces sp. SID13726 TaxID=2706058 RepID=UPI0013B7A645|nr:hypothetical protein [Streptomyces sp. SID13726]NEB00059.1 hypothetical protein [Streptomyces sp. SID13726]
MSRLSREKKRDQQRGAAPIDVRVPLTGEPAMVAGTPVTAPPGSELHQAVLTHLHHLALTTGHPIHATIHDARIGYVVPLEIAPDGSSRFSAEPVRMAPPGDESWGSGAGGAGSGGREPGEQGEPTAPEASGPGVPEGPSPVSGLGGMAAAEASAAPEDPDGLAHPLRPLPDPSPTFRMRTVAEPHPEADEPVPTQVLRQLPDTRPTVPAPGTAVPPTGEFGPPPVMDASPASTATPYPRTGFTPAPLRPDAVQPSTPVWPEPDSDPEPDPLPSTGTAQASASPKSDATSTRTPSWADLDSTSEPGPRPSAGTAPPQPDAAPAPEPVWPDPETDPETDSEPGSAPFPSAGFPSGPALLPSPGSSSAPAPGPGPAPAPAPSPVFPSTPTPTPQPLTTPTPIVDATPTPLPLPTEPGTTTPTHRPTPLIDPVPHLEDPDPKPAPVRGFDAVAEWVLGEGDVGGGAGGVLAESVGRISEAVREGRIDVAGELAEEVGDEGARTLGAEHPEVLRVRELAAYIAYLGGEPVRATEISLDLAGIQHRAGDAEAAYGNVQSAATAWRAVRDPLKGLALGSDLLTLWTEMAAGQGPAADDPDRLESARTRMLRLAERARNANS